MNTSFTNININLLKLFVTSEPSCTFLFTNNIAIRQVFAEKSSLFFFWYLIPSPLKKKKIADKCRLKPWVRRLSGQYLAKKNQNCPKHCISLNNISRGDYFFLRLKSGLLFEGGVYFKCCSLEVVPQIFCFIIPLYQKIITSNKLHEYGPFKCSKFGSLRL